MNRPHLLSRTIRSHSRMGERQAPLLVSFGLALAMFVGLAMLVGILAFGWWL